MLTSKQHTVYCFIAKHIQLHGLAPSYQEIAQHLGVHTTGAIRKYITALTEKGYITSEFGRSRSIQLTAREEADVDNGFPLVGKIAAGRPIAAFEEIEKVDLNDYFSGRESRYLLEVKGESMKDAGILDKDWVMIQAQSTAERGKIVVALVDGYDATLKYYQPNGDDSVSLIPANETMQPLVFSANRVQIQGVLVGQLRRY